jgi:hypothetical protein
MDKPTKSAIDWKKIHDELPPAPVDDPALVDIYAQLRWLDNNPPPEGNDYSGTPWIELHEELKQSILDDIERYRWRKAGYEPTREMLDACRDEEK